MEKPSATILVLTMAPNPETGRTIARSLVEDKIAACVNLLPDFRSVYRWEGEIQEESEVLLLIKTRADFLEDRLIPRILELHPYQIPEIIALPIIAGEKNYLEWLIQETPGR